MKSLRILVLAGSVLCLAAVLRAADDKPATGGADDTFTATCPVSGKAADKDHSSDYKGKKCYFCCDKCKAAFDADKTKYAVKANFQLVQSKQYVQAKCPLSGGALNKDQKVTLNEVEVTFCCDKCKGKVDAATGDDQLALVFAEDAFKKGFEEKKEKKD